LQDFVAGPLGHFFKKEHPYQERVYGDYLDRITWLDAIAPPLEQALGELNELGERWRSSLPEPQRLAEFALRVQDIRARDERVRLLHRPAAAPIPGGAGIAE
jgi:hypothetical protein